MRHTLTLDEDVDAGIAEQCRSSGKPFKEVVNETLRRGLAVRESNRTAPSLKLDSYAMGVRPGLSVDSISGIESLVEEGSL